LSPLQSGSFEDRTESSDRDVVAEVTGNGDNTGFGWMLKVAVAASGSHMLPSIGLKEPDQVTDLHYWDQCSATGGLGEDGRERDDTMKNSPPWQLWYRECSPALWNRSARK
jgi:hypothetical protein